MGQSILPIPPSISYKREVFLASSTFTLPITSYNKFDAILVSGGGGGAKNVNGNWANGGSGTISHFADVFCTNGTTLTITVGAGGAGQTSGTNNGADGTASTITGIAGNGTATSISSGAAQGGRTQSAGGSASLSPQIGFKTRSDRSNRSKQMAQGFGIGMTSFAGGTSNQFATANTNIFGSGSTMQVYSCNNVIGYLTGTGTGGPVPLLGSLLHANVGATGGAGSTSGGSSTANTYCAGTGGGAQYTSSSAGLGGGGGGGGRSTVGGTTGGVGGAGAANSGGGGGGGGVNTATNANAGNGGNGGSGFIVIGYWG
jgi:hypothetical protein